MENLLHLDDELRRLEGGGSGPWDRDRAAALVNRITYLDSIRPESGPVSSASEAAYYWNATHEQCLEELQELREELQELREDADSVRHVRPLQETIKQVEEHGRRAGIIYDLFLDAIRIYKPSPSKP